MTPEEVNKFLAKEVMGWTFNHGVRISKRLPPSPYYEGDGRIMAAAAWNPHHSIADAMRVVEKIISRGSAVLICHHFTDGSLWNVSFGWSENANHKSLPAAISLAAVDWAKAKKAISPETSA